MGNFFGKLLEAIRTVLLGKKSVESSAEDTKEVGIAIELINKFRMDNSLLPLQQDSTLIQMALEHSKYMARYNTLYDDLFPANLDFKLRYFRRHPSYKTMSVIKTTGKAVDFFESLRSHEQIRNKLLSSYYDLIGVAVCEGFWTLIMISKN